MKLKVYFSEKDTELTSTKILAEIEFKGGETSIIDTEKLSYFNDLEETLDFLEGFCGHYEGLADENDLEFVLDKKVDDFIKELEDKIENQKVEKL